MDAASFRLVTACLGHGVVTLRHKKRTSVNTGSVAALSVLG
jgi:hypothetical protein